jgi:hypothetical protein
VSRLILLGHANVNERDFFIPYQQALDLLRTNDEVLRQSCGSKEKRQQH